MEKERVEIHPDHTSKVPEVNAMVLKALGWTETEIKQWLPQLLQTQKALEKKRNTFDTF